MAALRDIKEKRFLSWAKIADELNAKKVVNHLGRKWTGGMVLEFVRIHQAATGERLCAWKGYVGSANGEKCLKEAREAYLEKRIELREERANEIRRYCSKVSKYSDGVSVLASKGCVTQWGPWTKTRLASFVRSYEQKCGERLMPLVVSIGGRKRKKSSR